VGPLIASALAAAAVLAGDHRGERDGEAVVWRSTYELPADATCATLVHPLAATHLAGDRVELDAQGRITAVCGEVRGQRLELTTSQPLPAERLVPPLAVGALQRVTLHQVVFEPDPGTSLQKGLTGSWWSTGVTRAERKALDRRYDRRGPRAGAAIYVSPAAVGADGLVGAVRAPGPTWQSSLGAAGLFGAALGLLGFAYRMLSRKARAERVQAWLTDRSVREELDADGVR
jgi:hypothetical protein